MKIIIPATIEIFCNNKLLRTKYSQRQLEAIYELLLSKKFGKGLMKYLYNQGLIDIYIDDVPLEGEYWNQYTETCVVIHLKSLK